MISSSRLRILDGILEYHAGAGQLLLRDSVGRIVRTGGFSYDGGTVSFPFHVVHGTGKPVLVADSSASCGANGSTSTGSRVRAPEVRVIGVIPTRSDEPGLLGPPPGKPVRHVDTTSTNSRGINGGSIPGTRVPRGGMGIDNTPSDLGEFDLDSLYAHFWSGSRVSTTSSPLRSRGESFGWWPGKVAGDTRSFAQVVSSPLDSMEDQGTHFNRGHRLDGFGAERRGRGAGRQDRGRGHPNVWRSNSLDPVQSSSNTGESAPANRWEEAAAAQDNRAGAPQDRWALAAQGVQLSHSKQGARMADKLGNIDSCLHCGSSAHASGRCPLVVCERCGKTGHLQAACRAVFPWEHVAQMCAFRSS